MKLYQKIIAGGLVVAGLAGLLGCDSNELNLKQMKMKKLRDDSYNQKMKSIKIKKVKRKDIRTKTKKIKKKTKTIKFDSFY